MLVGKQHLYSGKPSLSGRPTCCFGLNYIIMIRPLTVHEEVPNDL